MPYCPKCRYEYRVDVFKCPDCDEYLVQQLGEEEEDIYGENNDPNAVEWINIAKLTSTDYASLLTEVLQSKNIPVVAQSGTGHFGKIGAMGASLYAPVGGSISIFVPEEFVVAADIEADIVLGEVWQKSRLIETEIEYDSDPEDPDKLDEESSSENETDRQK